MRQCFRTASREAYSRAQPGYLQTNRCVLPVTKILQQSTAAIPFVASGWSELRGGRFALGFGATPIPSTGFCTTPILLTRRRVRQHDRYCLLPNARQVLSTGKVRRFCWEIAISTDDPPVFCLLSRGDG